MKFLKKIFALFLILALAITALAGCKGSNTNEDTSGRLTEDGVALLESPVVIAESDHAHFKVVRPDFIDDTMATCVSELRNPANGFSLSFEIAKADKNGNSDGEILIGNTCRDESKTEMEKIGYDDYSITLVNNKIVVAAHTPERLLEAVKLLKERLLQVKDGRLVYVGDYTYRSSAPLMIDKGESIADYKIVCGHDDLYMTAYNIQQYIKNKYGATLDIIFDTAAKSGKEIVLGDANREIAALTDTLIYGEGIIAVKNKDLLISAKDFISITKTVELFEKNYMSGTYTDGFNFKADLMIKGDVLSDRFKDPSALAKDTDIRVMSFNVLCELYNDKPAIAGRDEGVASTIINYLPDVVGLQEMSPNWHIALSDMLDGSPYKTICKKNNLSSGVYSNINFTPLLYNSDTVELIDSGIREYSVASKEFAYVITWGYFRHKPSGKNFAVANTHLDLRNQTEPYLTNRATQAAEFATCVKDLKLIYNCPVITTGDYNTTESEDGYKTIINNGGLSEAKYTAEKINRACNTYHNLGSTVSTAKGNSYDHIFGNDLVEFKYFNTLVDKLVLNSSDHCPIYADIKFK